MASGYFWFIKISETSLFLFVESTCYVRRNAEDEDDEDKDEDKMMVMTKAKMKKNKR